jgi:hypothetical protein
LTAASGFREVGDGLLVLEDGEGCLKGIRILHCHDDDGGFAL